MNTAPKHVVYEDVEKAVAELREAGQSPSVQRVIAHMQRGSATTVSRFLRDLRQKERDALPAPILDPAIAEQAKNRIAALVERHANELLGELMKPVDQRAVQINQEKAEALAEMQSDLDQANADQVRLQDEVAALSARNEQLTSANGRQDQRIADLLAQVEKMEAARVEDSAAAAKALDEAVQSAHDKSKAESERHELEAQSLRQLLESARLDAASATARADALQTQVSQLERSVEAQKHATDRASDLLDAEQRSHERTKADASTEREAARLERQGLATQLQQAEKAMRDAAEAAQAKLTTALSEAGELRGRLNALQERAGHSTVEAQGKDSPSKQGKAKGG